jgi:signal peptidase I
MTTEKKSSSKWVTVAIEVAIIVVAVMLGVALRVGVYHTAIVTSGSMENTLQVSDRMLIDHRESLHGQWQRGDIVLFNDPQSWQQTASPDAAPVEEGDELVKRVVGLPGETVDIYNNQVYINSKVLNEPYLKGAMTENENRRFTLSSGQYFVMGDNRNESDDSRARGPIEDNDIIGRAVRLVGPWGRFGVLSLPDYGN